MKPGYHGRTEAALAAYQHETDVDLVRTAMDTGRTSAQIEELLDAQTAGFDGLTTVAIDLIVDLMWRVDAAAAHGDEEMADERVRHCCGPHWLEDVAGRALHTYTEEGRDIAAGAADDDPDDVRDGVGVK